VAARLGILVSELEEKIDYSELMEWAIFFEMEMKQHTKEHYYLAQIAAMQSGKPKVKISDFLIKFGKEKIKPLKLTGKEQLAIFKKVLGIKDKK
jgi:hypothetical protein